MHSDEDDREDLQELQDLLRQARDKAHWLNVHRRLKMASHIEETLAVALRMNYDLIGQHQRGETRGFQLPKVRENFPPPGGRAAGLLRDVP